jgi:GNAT superfamily N-acetyltransferase
MMATNRSFAIRPAGPDDLVDVLRVLAEGGSDQGAPDEGAMDKATALETRTWERMMGTDGLTVYLAEVDGEAVGTATLLLMPNLTYDCAPTAFIEAVVVVEARRQQGIATAVMRRILADAQAAGANKVQLLSHKRHATDGAHRLYTSLGFKPEAEGFRLYLGPVPDAVRVAETS